MGEVYRARDTKLDRDVAIKVLPEAFAHDAERLARFLREAKTLAALNHPNIAAIYGLEESGGIKALVMELVEGDDLSQRIARGAIPIDEALPMAKQIADALEAAHEQHIIHRDLKTANIRVRADGTVKVLDFGLAKAMEPVGAMSPSVSQAPTITTPALMTGAGMILGTAAYMSSEQAKGRTVDKRSDVWAFGAVLYEMLTGTRAFGGEDVQDTFTAIMRDEPDWSRLPAGASGRIQQVLRACLQKNAKQRIGDVQSVRLALEGAFETNAPQTTGPTASSTSRGRLAWMVTAAAVLPASWSPDGRSLLYGALAPKTGFDLWVLPLGGDQKPQPFVNSAFGEQIGAFSPDGHWVAYESNESGRTEIYLRPFPGQGGQWQVSTAGGKDPRWRPDGKELYYLAPDSRLMAAPIASSGTALQPGLPTALFQPRIVGGGTPVAGYRQQYDVAPDGRFLINVVADDGSTSPITVIQNWTPEAKK